MSYQGHIERGVVVFNKPVPLPDGTHVIVEPVAAPRTADTVGDDFWHEPTVEELIAEQGHSAAQPWDQIVGQGSTLWDDDRQFDTFLQNIHDRRREGISS